MLFVRDHARDHTATSSRIEAAVSAICRRYLKICPAGGGCRAVRPTARAGERAAAEIRDAGLLEHVRRRTAQLSPTALESFLQCPFQYFTQRFLRLKTAPDRPEQRLDFLTQGNIVHAVLAEWWQEPQDIAALFERIFAAHLKEKHIPPGYHTERLRNAMLDDLRRFTAEDAWPRVAFQSQVEIKFCFPLDETVEINGRIDIRRPTGNPGDRLQVQRSAQSRLKSENLFGHHLHDLRRHLN